MSNNIITKQFFFGAALIVFVVGKEGGMNYICVT